MKNNKDYIDNMLKEAFRHTSLYPTQQIIFIKTSKENIDIINKAIKDTYANIKIRSPKTKSEE